MLSAEDQELLTQVGPDSDCGQWLRSFWFPVAISDQWDGYTAQLELNEPLTWKGQAGTATSVGEEVGTFTGDPLGIRILGEDLVLYRDLSGVLGLIDSRCPHRSSSMVHGRPRNHGLACAYHGWTFNGVGDCLDMPGEPADSKFKDKITITSYPVREQGGLIWTWMGEGEPPALPQLDVIARPGGVRVTENFCMWPANWLQIVENSVDQVHTGILHGEGSARADVWSQVPEVDWHADNFGIQTVQIRGDYGRTNYLRLPTTILLNQPWPGGKFDWPRYSAIFRTPVDDNFTLLFHVTHVPEVDGRMPELPDGLEFPAAGLVQTLFEQDYRAIVTQGRPVDRTIERLGTTDRGIILLRNMVMKGIDAVRRGEDPTGVLRGADGDALLMSSDKVTDGLMSVQAAE
jgi:5,5'-dehydrodivanillate O-demethylase